MERERAENMKLCIHEYSLVSDYKEQQRKEHTHTHTQVHFENFLGLFARLSAKSFQVLCNQTNTVRYWCKQLTFRSLFFFLWFDWTLINSDIQHLNHNYITETDSRTAWVKHTLRTHSIICVIKPLMNLFVPQISLQFQIQIQIRKSIQF